MLYLQHDFYNIVFKIKHKLYIPSGSAPSPKQKSWVRTCVNDCNFQQRLSRGHFFVIFCACVSMSMRHLKAQELSELVQDTRFIACTLVHVGHVSCTPVYLRELYEIHYYVRMKNG
jgi:hypothetical protein